MNTGQYGSKCQEGQAASHLYTPCKALAGAKPEEVGDNLL